MSRLPRRVRIARTADVASLRAVLSALRRHSSTRLELVLPDTSRCQVAWRLDEGAFEWLAEVTRPGSDSRLELVFSEAARQ